MLWGQKRRWLCAGAAATAAVTLAWAPGPRPFLGTLYDDAPVLGADYGVQDTTAVILKDLPLKRRIRTLVANGMSYSGDSLFAQRYMRLLSHLPALVAQGETRALVICIGTGRTAAALEPYGFERIDAVDISRGPGPFTAGSFVRTRALGWRRAGRLAWCGR